MLKIKSWYKRFVAEKKKYKTSIEKIAFIEGVEWENKNNLRKLNKELKRVKE